MQVIHRKYVGNVSYPSSGSTDYTLRTGFVNDAIREWAYEQNVLWKELYTNLSAAADGDKTATTSTTAYSAPSDFISISSFITITDSDGNKTYYFEKHPRDVKKVQMINSATKFFYVTGDAGSGHTINIVNPVAGTISYSYYKKATELSASTDKPEMSRPYYIVYSAMAQLYELDNRNDLVGKYLQLAKSVMDAMIIDNEVLAPNNPDKIPDLDYELRGAIIGQ